MPNPKSGISGNGQPMHYSVGAVIRSSDKYLLIDRAKPPYGYACPSGHIDLNESPIEALAREVREETGLRIKNHKLLFEEEVPWNECSKGVGIHYWYVFECEVIGTLKRNPSESRSIEWYSAKQIAKLALEPVWKYWFEKLGIINTRKE